MFVTVVDLALSSFRQAVLLAVSSAGLCVEGPGTDQDSGRFSDIETNLCTGIYGCPGSLGGEWDCLAVKNNQLNSVTV